MRGSSGELVMVRIFEFREIDRFLSHRDFVLLLS